MSDSRYPFTQACDYIRQCVGNDYGKGIISRAAASRAMQVVADALGHTDGHFAIACAVADMAKKQEVDEA